MGYVNFAKYGIDAPNRTSGHMKVKCPKCSNLRKNKTDKSLSINYDDGSFKCHYTGCDFSGYAKDDDWRSWTNGIQAAQHKVYKKPAWRNNTTLSEKAVKYFEGRGISQKTLADMKICEGFEAMPQAEGKKMNTIQFPYFLNGELVNMKYRTGNKFFKMVSGAELVLYNIDAIKESTEALITEGEFDALSYIEAGYKYAVSVPNGASSSNKLEFLDEYIESHFENKETIYIASDNDKCGIILRNELVRRLGAERCRIVTYGEGCKDANEHLVRYGKHSLLNTIEKAVEIKVEGIFRVSDFEAELDFLYENGLQRGLSIGHDIFDDLISFETGRLLTVTGVPSHGKSVFVDYIAECLNKRYGWKFAYFSPENYPLQIHASSLISKITGKKFHKEFLKPSEYKHAKQFMDENFFFIYPRDNFSLDNIFNKAAYLVKKKGINCLVIDPWNRLEHNQSPGMNETNYISKALDDICAFHQKHNIMTILVAHPTKMKRDAKGNVERPTLYDINGSANFYNKSDFGISVYRDTNLDIVEVNVQKVKFRHLGKAGRAYFRYNINNGRFSDAVLQGGEYVCLQWDNTNHLVKNEPEEQDLFDLTPTDEPPPF